MGKLEVSSNLPLATFDSAEESTTHTWRQQNDPVMGGASSGSFSIADGVGIMNGTVAIIPRLGVPGFIKVQTTVVSKQISMLQRMILVKFRCRSISSPSAGMMLLVMPLKLAQISQSFAHPHHACRHCKRCPSGLKAKLPMLRS